MRFTETHVPGLTLWMAKHNYVAHGGRLFLEKADAEAWASTMEGMVVFPVTAWKAQSMEERKAA